MSGLVGGVRVGSAGLASGERQAASGGRRAGRDERRWAWGDGQGTEGEAKRSGGADACLRNGKGAASMLKYSTTRTSVVGTRLSSPDM